MKENLRPLLISELLQATSYQERLWRALSEITKNNQDPALIQNISKQFEALKLPWALTAQNNLKGAHLLQKFHR